MDVLRRDVGMRGITLSTFAVAAFVAAAFALLPWRRLVLTVVAIHPAVLFSAFLGRGGVRAIPVSAFLRLALVPSYMTFH